MWAGERRKGLGREIKEKGEKEGRKQEGKGEWREADEGGWREERMRMGGIGEGWEGGGRDEGVRS